MQEGSCTRGFEEDIKMKRVIAIAIAGMALIAAVGLFSCSMQDAPIPETPVVETAAPVVAPDVAAPVAVTSDVTEPVEAPSLPMETPAAAPTVSESSPIPPAEPTVQ